MTGIKHPFASPPPPTRLAPSFDLEQQMRLFIAERRAAAHLLHQSQSQNQNHIRTPSLNKSLPTPPSPSPLLERAFSKHSKKQSKNKVRFAISSPQLQVPNLGRSMTRTELRSVPHTSSQVGPPPDRRFKPATDHTRRAGTSPACPEDRYWAGLATPDHIRRAGTNPGGTEDRYWSSLATPELAIPPRPWTSPECSPLLPPPRGNELARTEVDISTLLPPGEGMGVYPADRSRIPARKPVGEKVLPRRITIESQIEAPRTAPPPPTPAKSQTQQRRAGERVASPLKTPVGFLAELEGSVPAKTRTGERKMRKRKAKPAKIKPDLVMPRAQTPEGKELYATLPLPAVPPPASAAPRSSESSPVIDVELEIGYADGLVEWFENFRWGEAVPSPSNERNKKGRGSTNTFIVPLLRSPHTPKSGDSTFSHDDRASVLDPNGAVRTSEPPRAPNYRLTLSPSAGKILNNTGPVSPMSPGYRLTLAPALFTGVNNNSGLVSPVSNTALLSPVYPVSPRLDSYYGARNSFASSVGDAFRFDREEREADVDELYPPQDHHVETLDQQVYCEEEEVPGLSVPSLSVPGLSVPGLSVPALRWGAKKAPENRETVESIDIAGLYGGAAYDEEGDDDISDSSNEFDSRLEQEIEMILSGSYGGGSPADWRDGIYSAGSSSPDQEAGWEGNITVGLDLGNRKKEVGMGIEGVEGEAGWRERPRTRYIAGRNSMLDSDVIFCLRGEDSM